MVTRLLLVCVAGYFNHLESENSFFVFPPNKMGQYMETSASKISCFQLLTWITRIHLSSQQQNTAGMNTKIQKSNRSFVISPN
ncbi:hypothetical protein I79_017021 [Cricetulus griseus]|uniref:Uncharacterized protein n=1 Tax=Cricetulus griseus TaxID=10029 RepID=G3I0X9_CRIGR|nr:hypothetical protein I79_017021 [Cricetulus griseus]